MGMSAHASSLETFVGVFAVVAGGFLYGQIVGSVTEINRKRNMASDVSFYIKMRTFQQKTKISLLKMKILLLNNEDSSIEQ